MILIGGMKMGKMVIIMLCIVLMFSYASENVPTIFTKSLGRDINGDAKIDSAVILKNIYRSISYVDNLGNIYICGVLGDEIIKNICIVKILPNGKVDESFGSKGKVKIQELGEPTSIFVDKDRNIFITIKYVTGACVIKIKNNGSLDNNFGKEGKKFLVSIASGKYEKVISMLINSIYVDKSGSIFVTGSITGSVFRQKKLRTKAYVVKMKGNGDFDENFGNQGKIMFNVGNSDDYERGKSIYVDEEENIIISGNVFRSGIIDSIIYLLTRSYNSDIFIVRLRKDGSIDKSFGKRGKVVLDKIADQGTYDLANLMFVDKEGSIFIAGASGKNIPKYPYIVKIKKDGKIDKEFGKEGKVVLKKVEGIANIFSSIYADKNGSLLVSLVERGNMYKYTSHVVKLKPNGDMEETFGNQGRITLDSIVEGNKNTTVSLVTEDPEGNILIIGNSFNDVRNKEKAPTFVIRFPFFR